MVYCCSVGSIAPFEVGVDFELWIARPLNCVAGCGVNE